MNKDMKMIDHYAPTDKLNAREFGGATHHLNEIVALFFFKEVNAMSNAADEVMDGIHIMRFLILRSDLI